MFILKTYRINVKKELLNQDDTSQRVSEYYEEIDHEPTLLEELQKLTPEPITELSQDFFDYLELWDEFDELIA